MTDQPQLFDEKQVRTADGHKFVQEAPEPEPTPEETRNAALAKLKADGKADTIRAQYARLLWRAQRYGVIIELPEGHRSGRDEVTVRSLTDKEAAYILRCQNTTICGRRGELMGKDDSLPEYAACPVVEPDTTRRSYIRDSGQAVTAYRLIPTLFD